MPDPLLQHLGQVVGPEHVLVEPDQLGRYERDWTGRWHGEGRCVVRPAATGQVVAVVEACARAGAPLVVQGGNTGLVGGAVPVDGAVVLSTERLDEIGEVDASNGRVLVGAGATLAQVADAAEAADWAVGVDLASRDSATIGGMVATDAGGSRVVAHGPMRDHVGGLEVVLADGTVARPWLEGLDKDTAGYDLRHLLVGSEGTLGVVTRVLLDLVRPAPTAVTLLLGTDAAELHGLVAGVRAAVATSPAVRLTACEFITAAGARLVADVLGLRSPVDSEIALLVDLAGDVDDGLLAQLDELSSTPAVVGLDERSREQLWRLREGHTEAISQRGVPVKLDVAVPLARLAWFLDAVPATVATVAPSATCLLFGHAAEGNVHVNVIGCEDPGRLEDAVYRLVAEAGGTISAEHGIGRAKVAHLGLTRDAGSIAAMHRIKHALDPDSLFNPGVVLPVEGR